MARLTATRAATAHDREFVEDMLVEAANWDPSRPRASRDDTLREAANARYVEGWPRESDVGVVAVDGDGKRLGAAWYRFLTAADPGYGFVNDDTPEVALAVVGEFRGQGIGGLLLTELAAAARQRGVGALSLSVDTTNPAVDLYRRHGYCQVGQRAGSYVMVLPLTVGGPER
jgi:ribosomal protein S18 acetylase RimI-like enzyme